MPTPVKGFGGFHPPFNASNTRAQDDHEERSARPLLSHLHQDNSPREDRKPISHPVFSQLFQDNLRKKRLVPTQSWSYQPPQNNRLEEVFNSIHGANSEDSGELRARRQEIRARRIEREQKPSAQKVIIKRPGPRVSPQHSCVIPSFIEDTAPRKAPKAFRKEDKKKRLNGPKWDQDSEKLVLIRRNLTRPGSVDSWKTPHIKLERPRKNEKPRRKAIPISKDKEELLRKIAAENRQRVKVDRAIRKEKMKYIEEWRHAVVVGAYKEAWRVIEISVVADCPPENVNN